MRLASSTQCHQRCCLPAANHPPIPHPYPPQPAKPLSRYLDFWQAQPSASLNVHAPPFVSSVYPANGGVYKVMSSCQWILAAMP